MIRGMYSAASGLITSEAKQNVIMNNMANVNTIGYKSEIISLKSFDEVYISNRDKISGGKNVKNTIGSISNGVELNERVTNFSQGLLKQTGLSTDFGIQGDGFFAVQRVEGNATKTYYTRDGHFAIDNSGYLVTSSGDRVLGNNGQSIHIGSGEISCNKDGEIFVSGEYKGTLSIVDFPRNNDNGEYVNLTKVGFNLYEGNNPTPATGAFLQHKYLEGSNVNTIEEMSDMMTVMRNFESNTKVLKILDETLGKAVNEIGNVK